MKWLLKLLGKVRLIDMTEEMEKNICVALGQIPRIQDYLELHKLAGYQLYGRTKDEKYLGYVEFAQSLQTAIAKSQKVEEVEEESKGYDAQV